MLASFGGYGLPGLDTDALAKFKKYTVVTTANLPLGRARKETPTAERKGSFISVNEEAMYDAGVRYEDLVGAAEAVVTKPGYGIISECIANDTAILYTSRGHFPEYDVLVEEMPKYLRSAFISHDDLFAGKWEAASRQAARAAEDEEEAGDQRRRRRRRHPAEGARQAAEEAARTAEGEVLGERIDTAVARTVRPTGGRPRRLLTFCLLTAVRHLMQVTSDQILGTFTFSIDIGCSSAWARKPGRSRSDLKPMCTVNGEIARSSATGSGSRCGSDSG